MVVFEVEVGFARIHPSHLFEESRCYSNFLPRFDSSIYLGEIGNRSFSSCEERQQMLKNGALVEPGRLWNPVWWQLFVSRGAPALGHAACA